MRYLVIFVLSLVLLAATCACSHADFANSEPAGLKVVTTIYPLYSMVSELGGEKVSALYLLPAGASPHTYEPTTEQARQVSEAALFVYIGADLDQWAAQLTGSAGHNQIVLDLSQKVPLIDYTEEAAQQEASGSGQAAGADPHYWLDPLLVKDYIAPALTEALVALEPAGQEYFNERLSRFQEELALLDIQIKTALSACPQNKYITFHSAWRYFAHRYGLEEVAVITRFPGQEPSAGWMAGLVRLIEEEKIKAVFAEPQLSTALAEQIAAESGIKVLLLDPIGGENFAERDTYQKMMRYNLQMFAEGLGAVN